MWLIGFIHMTKETGCHFSTPQAANITSMKWTRIYFGGLSMLCPVLRCHACCWTICKWIYTGKGSAFTGYWSAPKRSQAEIHRMREVFSKAVTYAAVQVSPQRLNCSNSISQSPSQAYYGCCSLLMVGTHRIGFSNSMSFFYECVRLFTKDPKNPWVIDTLNFLMRYSYSVLFLPCSFYINKCQHQCGKRNANSQWTLRRMKMV